MSINIIRPPLITLCVSQVLREFLADLISLLFTSNKYC